MTQFDNRVEELEAADMRLEGLQRRKVAMAMRWREKQMQEAYDEEHRNGYCPKCFSLIRLNGLCDNCD